LMSAVYGYRWGMSGKQGQILCAREHLNSLDESSLEEVKSAIRSVDWLDAYYEIGEKYIRSRDGRVSYVFSGLRRNLDSIKSKARVILAWVDEAENVSEAAWQKLIPTIREEESEIWVTYNPESKHSAVHQRFRVSPSGDVKVCEINWRDNPWFPDVLNQERINDQKLRPDVYDHVWEGAFLIPCRGRLLHGRDERSQRRGSNRKRPIRPLSRRGDRLGLGCRRFDSYLVRADGRSRG
jgi:phage terminase large subunit